MNHSRIVHLSRFTKMKFHLGGGLVGGVRECDIN